MSKYKTPCPSCGAALEIDESAPAGKVIRCPECGAGLTLSGEKGRPFELKQPPKSSKSGKSKGRPRLAWGLGGGMALLAPAKI
jgi:predicted Zn finger-like uncharacterized protein